MTILIQGSVRVQPAQRERAEAAALRMSTASEAEPGCERYRFAADLADPEIVWVFEEWADTESLEAHFASAHFAEFVDELGAWVDGEVSVTRYEIASSGPVF
jgi:quinol monooxygenase YgiN